MTDKNRLRAESVTVKGCCFNADASNGYAVDITGCDNVVIKGCRFSGPVWLVHLSEVEQEEKRP